MALNTRHNIVRSTDAYKIPQVGLDPTGVQFLMECAYCRNGEWVNTSKNPDSDAYKKSQGGRLKLIRENDKFQTVDISEPGEDLLVEVFRDGKILKEWTFAEVKANGKL